MAITPLDLPRLVMRRAAWVAALVLGLAVLLGLWRMADDIDGEVRAAQSLARLVAQLGTLDGRPETAALQALQALQQAHPLRHLELRVYSAEGRLLLGPPDTAADGAWTSRVMTGLARAHRALLDSPTHEQPVQWALAGPDGSPWRLTLTASHESERREAIGSLLGVLALLLACVAGLLLVMRWNLRRAFLPLGRLLDAMVGIEAHDTRAVQALPTMPIRELEVLAGGLRQLAGALDQAEAARRLLSRQVLTLQEDERARLARELHDEFGQRLTALRADAAWLGRRLAQEAPLREVVLGMAAQCERLQGDTRLLLARLQPFGPGEQELTAGRESLQRLAELLQALVASWSAPGRGESCACQLVLAWRGEQGQPLAWPGGAANGLDAGLQLPRELALVLYRISQEALTNVARHAQAAQVVLQLTGHGRLQAGAAVQLDWRVQDDGLGLAQQGAPSPQGNGLAGMRERVWAQGADLQIAPLQPGQPRPGLSLSARFTTVLVASGASSDAATEAHHAAA